LDLSQAYETLLHKIPIDFVSQTWFLQNLSEGDKKIYDKIKRFDDIILTSLIVIITSPLWLIFALLIKLEDKGPMFYKQKRVSKDGKDFWLTKFRSMKVDAENGEAKWAEKNDPRITKIGRFLRKIHLDELPQMINVLKGDISLVGPRPERPEFVKKLEKEIPHYQLRHIIRPGFTGWAQIKFRYGRTIEDSHEKFQYDLYYIKNRSLFLDLGVLLKTFQLFFTRE
jgi:exopolysaccharide biosynthesis polyprenyl glycosylphosphotransferase